MSQKEQWPRIAALLSLTVTSILYCATHCNHKRWIALILYFIQGTSFQEPFEMAQVHMSLFQDKVLWKKLFFKEGPTTQRTMVCFVATPFSTN